MFKLLEATLKVFLIAAMVTSSFYTDSAYAQPMMSVSVSTMLQNLSNSVPALMQLTVALAYVLGFYFVTKSIFALKEYGESRTQMSSQHSLKTPTIYMAVG